MLVAIVYDDVLYTGSPGQTHADLVLTALHASLAVLRWEGILEGFIDPGSEEFMTREQARLYLQRAGTQPLQSKEVQA